MDEELAKIVTQMPRKGAEAEGIAEFPLRDQAPAKVEDVKPVQARPRQLLDGAEVERLGEPKRLTEAEYAEKKRRLPPLWAAPKRGKFLTYDRNRRDIAAGREQAEQSTEANAELAKAVAGFGRKWDRR